MYVGGGSQRKGREERREEEGRKTMSSNWFGTLEETGLSEDCHYLLFFPPSVLSSKVYSTCIRAN